MTQNPDEPALIADTEADSGADMYGRTVLHIPQFSTGLGSAEVARRVVEKHGAENTVLLTADTTAEDEDNWRFAQEVVEFLGYPRWVLLRDGRTPMQVGRDHRAVPNNQMAICSRVLKRELLRGWLEDNCDPARSVIYLGFDWTEQHRWDASVEPWAPWTIAAPLMERPYKQKADLIDQWRDYGIEPPRLYAQGFHHANCGGACVRGGQAQWALLLRVNRERYLEWEAEEETTRDLLQKDVTILKDRTGGFSRPLSLREFRQRLDLQPSLFDSSEWGACACF